MVRPSPGWAGAIGALSLLAACGGGPSGGPSGGTDPAPGPTGSAPVGSSTAAPSAAATIEIRVRIGEQCHPEPMTPGPSCRPQPRPDTEVSVVDTATDEVVEVRTDAHGEARAVVHPGTYVVRAAADDRYPETPQQTVTVAPGEVARADLTYLVGFQ